MGAVIKTKFDMGDYVWMMRHNSEDNKGQRFDWQPFGPLHVMSFQASLSSISYGLYPLTFVEEQELFATTEEAQVECDRLNKELEQAKETNKTVKVYYPFGTNLAIRDLTEGMEEA